MNPDQNDISNFSLNDRDSNVLHTIGEEGLSNFTFEGIKRRIGLHPETLSRILYRLEEQGLIERVVDGYNITSKGLDYLRIQPLSAEEPRIALLNTILPPDIPVQQVIHELRGRWFGILRWLGSSEDDGKSALKWITDDGGIQVEAHFSEGGLSIEAKLLREKDVNVAIMASYQLLGYISRLYSKNKRFMKVVHLTVYDPNSTFS
jgi:DNA-binding Lrp family transcriptional regulator